MGRRKPVACDDRPLVLENADFGFPHIDHGFDGKSHSGFQRGAGVAFAKVGNLRFFMQLAPDTMSHKFSDDAVTIADGLFFNKSRDISQFATSANELNGSIEDLFRGGAKALHFGADDSDKNRCRIISDPTVTNDANIHFHDVAILDAAGSADAMDDLFI